MSPVRTVGASQLEQSETSESHFRHSLCSQGTQSESMTPKLSSHYSQVSGEEGHFRHLSFVHGTQTLSMSENLSLHSLQTVFSFPHLRHSATVQGSHLLSLERPKPTDSQSLHSPEWRPVPTTVAQSVQTEILLEHIWQFSAHRSHFPLEVTPYPLEHTVHFEFWLGHSRQLLTRHTHLPDCKE